MQRKLILFELNEVPYRVIDEFCSWRPSSCLARLLKHCRKYETYAEDQGMLSPWITWPSLHRGVSNERHGITSFGQELRELDREFPPLWSILAGNGVSTGVFGTLHSYPPPQDLDHYAFYVPDTFAAGSECFPKVLTPFQEFNLSMAHASNRNVNRRVNWQAALSMLSHLPALGFRPGTLARMGGQLVSERLQGWRRTRRRTCQVVLAFDVFMKQLRRTRPRFATFFTNHVASSMHRYWAAAFPGDYDEFHIADAWVKTYRNEIDFTMCCFDRFLGRLVRFVERHPEYTLMVASSMGQAATVARLTETELHITDLPRFMSALGVEPGYWQARPAMAPDTSVIVAAERCATFRAQLKSLVIGNRPVYHVEHEYGFFHIRLDHPDSLARLTQATLGGEPTPLAELGMSHVAIEDRSGCTAYHIPQGTLLIYDPRLARPGAGQTQISTLDIAPGILQFFDVHRPAYMQRSSLRAA